MKDKISQTIANLLASLIATVLSVWRVINWVQVRNVIDLITSFLLMLIALAGVGKLLRGWEFPIIKKTKTKPERTYDVVVETEKQVKGVVKMLLGLREFIRRLARTTWANKLSITDDLIVTGAWVGLTYNFLEKYGYTLNNQPWHFWAIAVGLLVSYILVIIGVNHVGAEGWNDWVARVGRNKVNKYVNKVIKVGIDNYPDKAQKLLDKAKMVFNEVQELFDTDTRIAIQEKLDELQAQIDYEMAERTYAAEQRKKLLLEIAEQKKKAQHTKNEPQQQPQNTGSGIRRI